MTKQNYHGLDYKKTMNVKPSIQEDVVKSISDTGKEKQDLAIYRKKILTSLAQIVKSDNLCLTTVHGKNAFRISKWENCQHSQHCGGFGVN